MKTAVSKVWTGACWVDAMLKTHAKVVEYKDGKSVYDILKPLEPYIAGTIQKPLTVQNPRAANKTTIASDGIHIGTETSEVHYGKGFIVDKYGEVETVYGLPKEGGTLVTEGKARTLAQEEIAKYDFIKIVEELPDEGLPNRIYLVPHEAEEGSKDLFDMWLWVNDAWEFEGTKSAEIDNTLYVKFTDYATNGGRAGALKLNPNGGAYTGLHVNENGELCLAGTAYAGFLSDAFFNNPQNYGVPVLSKDLYRWIKVGLVQNTETWTDEEKASACETLGAIQNAKPSERNFGDGVVLTFNSTGKLTFTSLYGTYIAGASIPYRDSAGVLHANTPTTETGLTPKKYVDGLIADAATTKLDKVETSATEVYVHKNNTQGTVAYSQGLGSNAIVQRIGLDILVPDTPGKNLAAASKKYVDSQKGTKLYHHELTGVSGTASTGETITSIILVSTVSASITGGDENTLLMLYLSAVNSYIPYTGKITDMFGTSNANEVKLQFHNRLKDGEVESITLNVRRMTDTVTAL